MTNKIELTLEEIHTYLACPAKYKFEHINEIKEEKNKSIRIKEAIHKTIYYFFFSVMNEQVPSMASIKDKWASMCEEYFGDEIVNESIFSVRQGYKLKQSQNIHRNPEFIKGLEMLHYFYQFNKDNPGVPIAVDHEYRIAMGDVVLRGRFELVRELIDTEDRKRYIEVVDFKTGDKPLEYLLVKNDMNLMLASYAFRQLFNTEEDRAKYHYMSLGKDIVIKYSDQDYGRIKSIVAGVADGIKNKHFYPRQTFMCRQCSHKDICVVAKF